MQLSGTVLRIIEEVLHEAEERPADAVLRSILRAAHLSPEQRSLVSRAVFSYYRWLGWLNSKSSLRGQLEHAFDLSVGQVNDSELLEKAIPTWTREVMDFTPAMAREFQAEPRLWLRARPGTGAELAIKLGDCELHPKVIDALWYRGERDLLRSPEFHNGAFEIQDLSSQIVGVTCAPLPGSIWWDACAGEGGKTLHLCDLMENKGLVWASDPAQWRLDILKRRASRAKLFNYRIKLWARPEQLPTKTKFDGVLVDAPCSGVGTWGRNPHARWTTKPEEVLKLAALQIRILGRAAESIKPGGRLIYSVCTLTRAETTEVAKAFNVLHSEFSPLEQFSLQPEEWHSIGMFAAAWKRRE